MNTDILASLSKIGDGNLVPFSDTNNGMVEDWLFTLMPKVDVTLYGGIPLSGRATQIYGDPNVGKSTFVMNMISIAQKMGIIVIYYDVEGTTNKERLRSLGVDVDTILTKVPSVNKDGTVNPLTIEDIMENMTQISAAVHKQDPKVATLFVWDTVGMTQSQNVAESDFGAQWVGNQAKALSEGIRKLNANLIANNGSLIALNQARDDLKAANSKYAKKNSVGGNAWLHEMTYSLYMNKGSDFGWKTQYDVPIGHKVKLQLKKSKLGAVTGDNVESYMLSETGFDLEFNILAEAQEVGLASTGAWITYNTLAGEEIKKNGKEDFVKYLKSSEGRPVYNEMFQRLIKGYFPTCYSPLFNVNVAPTEEEFPELTGLKDYYIDIQENLPKEGQNSQYLLWKQSQDKKPKKRGKK